MNKPNQLTQTDIRALLLFFAFILLYLLPGVYGHTPWKQDENYSFGIIHTMYETGNWLVTINAGQPFMEKPPLYYWTATSFIHLLSPWLPMHDAARTASLFFSVTNFSFFILLARRVLISKTLRTAEYG
ncbi:ArnT family glycosyltransferase [Xenorhabdus sp. PR6a]|uniref:ArnT family glycosyltransferase n=1 Tax=Xenorhabdus sp. PR6a TaxID=3025877 RepID=UPI0030806487